DVAAGGPDRGVDLLRAAPRLGQVVLAERRDLRRRGGRLGAVEGGGGGPGARRRVLGLRLRPVGAAERDDEQERQQGGQAGAWGHDRECRRAPTSTRERFRSGAWGVLTY